MVRFRRVFRIAGLIAAFAASGAATCWGIRAIASFPHIAQIADKLDAFEEAPEAHDVLFFGSSKIYSGIIPATFDRVLAEHGFHVRSYNLGVDGMGYPESGYLCEEALERRPGTARWVFLEAAAIRTHIPPSQRDTRRFRYWHDFPRTELVAETIRARRSSGRTRANDDPDELLRLHLAAFLRRSINMGEGAELLETNLQRQEPEAGRDRLIPEQRGYCAITNVMAGTELVNYRKSLSRFDAVHKPAEPITEAALLEFAADAARQGASTILIGTPNPAANPPLFASTGQAATSPTFFNFADPARYPLLYREDHRGDSAHLNHAGAEAFTVYLAERFAEHLRESRPPQAR